MKNVRRAPCALRRSLEGRARSRWLPVLMAAVAQLSFTAVALAEATVVVELKGTDGSAAEGTVQLSHGETRLRCSTSQGRCEIKNVPGGSYTVSVEQGGQATSKPKTVMIPPQGEVKLIVAAK